MLSFFGLLLIIIGILLFIYSIYGLLFKSSHKDEFMKKEAKRVLRQNAIYTKDYTSEGRVFTKGIGIYKERFWDKKVKIIPQAKVCDIGLIN